MFFLEKLLLREKKEGVQEHKYFYRIEKLVNKDIIASQRWYQHFATVTSILHNSGINALQQWY